MDADDRLDEENRRKLKDHFSRLPDENIGYVMKCLCLPDFQSGVATVVDHVRLFRNDPQIRWRYRVHEQILIAIRESGGDIRWAEPVIHHTGYQNPARRPQKLQRDVRLLRLDDAERPEEPFTLFNLGWTSSELGDLPAALSYLRRSLAKSGDQDSIVRKIYALMCQIQRRMGQDHEAARTCREGLQKCPDDPELLYEDALLLTAQGNLAATEARLVHLLKFRGEKYFASVDPALRGYRAYDQLGILYRRQGRDAEARQAWAAVLSERADYAPALLGLLEIALEHQDWPTFQSSLLELEKLPNHQMETAVMRARAHQARKEFGIARELLEAARDQFPDAIWPRLILSHVLLQEDKDPDAAEMALRDVLALAPDHIPTQQNLRLLLEARQKPAGVP